MLRTAADGVPEGVPLDLFNGWLEQEQGGKFGTATQFHARVNMAPLG